VNQLVKRTQRDYILALSKVSATSEQRIKELEEKLCLVEKKAEFFEDVIDVMEKDYGVSVKSGQACPQARTRCRINR